MMYKIKILTNQLLKNTIFMYLKNMKKQQYTLNLNAVTSFWSKVEEGKKKKEKIILVECMEDITLKYNSTYSIVALLSKLSKTKVVALTSYSSYQETVNFLSFYHPVDKVESVYKALDFITKIKAFIILCKNIPFVYNLEYGFKVIVNDIDIGDLVYDEYLRIARVETCRKTTFLFYLISYNAIYQHLRYQIILDRNSITDIVAIRDTYSHSSFYRASSHLDEITIWKTIFSPSRVIFSKLQAYKDFNYKPQYFKKKHLEYIKNNYSKYEIINMYDTIISVRREGNVNDSIDSREMALAHSNHDINSISDFYNYYTINQSKKTVIVYSHVFVDAVRYSHHTIFSDYYTWLVETLKFLLENKDVNILVKPHPSEILYSLGKVAKDVIHDFNLQYSSNVIFLEKKIDANIIYELTDVIVTASGTIGVEAPCLGVKVITAGSTMYENTNAMFRSKTQEEYFNLLNNFESLPEIREEQMFNSKIGFIWINKLIYNQSQIYSALDEALKIEKQVEELNRIYEKASVEDIKKLLKRIKNNNFN